MEQLRALQRKNAVLIALQSSWDADHLAPAVEEQTLLVETLQALAEKFGSTMPERVALLCRSAALLEDASLMAILAAADSCRVADPRPNPVAEIVPSLTPCCVTIEGVDLAQSALEDFVCSYFMFHGLSESSPRDIFKHLPFLGFMEGHLYGLDQVNEDNLLPAMVGELWHREPPLREDPFGPLRQVLAERRWLTPRLELELKGGSRFWLLERKLCAALADPESEPAPLIDRGDVEAALRLKSFDYRAMNLLLYAMRGEEHNEEHMEFLATSEVLVELGDDLTDYAEDAEKNSFNVYRCFLAIYGPDEGPLELSRYIQALESKYAAALKRLEPSLAERWLQRGEASLRHGAGSERGAGGGSWEIPSPIDERALRRERTAER
ncbi:unnamed protein product [Polarella glacialis]|uniref:Uncharacterized protein n=1 Tax=Polarella glacialis TaxID=89957 RepID=A0A813KWH3_POLGL|nr:unnamed protein product [Polarella glacialis]CAE8714913.1 unnamed protein product [Polarella glacialis]